MHGLKIEIEEINWFTQLLDSMRITQLNVSDIIQIFILFFIIVYAYYTIKIYKTNELNTEYNIKPVIGIEIENDSEWAKIRPKVTNYSNTDAFGLVHIQQKSCGTFQLNRDIEGLKKFQVY